MAISFRLEALWPAPLPAPREGALSPILSGIDSLGAVTRVRRPRVLVITSPPDDATEVQAR
jgi:hypothetical protein